MEQDDPDGPIKRFELLLREKNRIEELLCEYVGRKRALEIASLFLKNAERLDEIARKICVDPTVRTGYTYDGMFFRRKDTFGWSVSHDGLRFLSALQRDNLGCFFGNSWGGEEQGMFRWIKTAFLDIPEIRLRLIQEDGRIEFANKEMIQELLEKEREKRKKTSEVTDAKEPLSVFDLFLEPYEREMEEWSKRNKL